MAEGDWWQHGVVYQIYPRSFQDSNGDGIGDLPGITTRLDHLNDGTNNSLGIDAIWISPFYPSPMADFGYDVADYCDVDPTFGTLADFDELLGECHRRSIRVIIDFVPNHTSDRHSWFIESCSSRDSPKRDWYVWADPRPEGSPPTNWLAAFQDETGTVPAWTLDPGTGQYYLHTFLREQPDLNWLNPDVREAMHVVLRFWLDRGVDGFRIDAVQALGHDPELRDNPAGIGEAERPFDVDLPIVHAIVRGFRRILDEYDDRMAVGEVYLFDPECLVRYYGEANDEFHLAFNFSFLQQPWSAVGFRGAVERFESALPPGAWPDYTLSNHDHRRTASRYDEGGKGQARARVAAMMLLTLRGTPFLYCGEEIGMTDGPIPAERVVDVAGRDPERTPMQWRSGPGAGFTDGEPWLPISPDADVVNVVAQDGNPASMLSLYRRLIWYRKGSTALQRGAYRSLDVDEDVFAFIRECQEERVLVALNFSDRALSVNLAGALDVGRLRISTDPEREAGRIGLNRLRLGPNEGVIVTV